MFTPLCDIQGAKFLNMQEKICSEKSGGEKGALCRARRNPDVISTSSRRHPGATSSRLSPSSRFTEGSPRPCSVLFYVHTTFFSPQHLSASGQNLPFILKLASCPVLSHLSTKGSPACPALCASLCLPLSVHIRAKASAALTDSL